MAFILTRRLQPLRGLVDLVPIVTVVLLLLLFFVLSSSFVLQPGIKVDPPHSQFGVGTTSRLIVAVTMPPPQVDANGAPIKSEPTLYFDDQIVSLDELRSALDHLSTSRTTPDLVIKADREVPLDEIMRIEDIALAHHLAVIIGTQPPTRSP